MNQQVREQIINFLLQQIDQAAKVIEDLQKRNTELQKALDEKNAN